MIAVSTLGMTPQVVAEFVDELLKRKVDVKEVIVLPTKKSLLSYRVLHLDFKFGKYKNQIKIECKELDFEDIKSPEDCRTFRVVLNRVLKGAVKRAQGPEKVHLSVAGGRKTMQADSLLIALIHGIPNIYHVIAEEITGTADIGKSLNDEEKKIVERCSTEGIEPPPELVSKLTQTLHPENLTVHLIKIPVPKLDADAAKELKEQLVGR